MNNYSFVPEVSQEAEFLEIAKDFTNPLEAVREAISNSFDYEAKRIEISFLIDRTYGEGNLIAIFKDNGKGMDKDGIRAFFDLGNSMSRKDEGKMGEKGHGTKVFFRCEEIVLETIGPDKIKRRAVMQKPFHNLCEGKIPRVNVEENVDLGISLGTCIKLVGFNNNRAKFFTHEQLKDYILWFTKFGSFEMEFGIKKYKDMKLHLKGIDKKKSGEFEILKFGHIFAVETSDMNVLFDQYETDAPKYFAKKWIKTGNLKNNPDCSYQAVFAIEGDLAKRKYNDMISRQGKQNKEGMYKVTDRYGLYLCKDFVPVERTHGWLGAKSTDHLKFHAFINCQGFYLTANRGSVKNTPQPILNDIREIAEEIRREIIESDEYNNMEFLEEEAQGAETAIKEEKEYKRRMSYIKDQKTTTYKGVNLIQPRQESGVFALLTQMTVLEPDCFPFQILDYDTKSGIDVLARTSEGVPVGKGEIRYIEFKYMLSREINHTLRHLYAIVSWDLHPSLKKDPTVEDIGNKKARLKIESPDKKGEWTRYYLDVVKSTTKIEVFILKEYLKERYGISFE